VITADGIVGKVREVFPHTAQVLAINDQTSGAGVILETTRIRGILRGNAAGRPQIVGILADQRIQPGEKVLTAGGDQIFPRGLAVGVVEKVIRDPERDSFINVIVKPAAQLDRLDEVLVITSTAQRFSPDQQQDLAISEDQKGAEVEAIKEQKEASEIMAERLPGLTDPNAPQAAPGAASTSGPGQAGQQAPNPATPVAASPAPKLMSPRHSDRFTPGAAEEAAPSAVPEDKPKPKQPSPKPESKPKSKANSKADQPSTPRRNP